MNVLSPETLRFVAAHQGDDVRALALRGTSEPGVDLTAALTQIAGRQVAAHKLPSWHRVNGLLYPTRLSLEQCSSEEAARYKASLLSGDSLTDLTGGLGVDCAFLAQGFRQVDYVERQEALCDLARHNFPLLGLTHISVHHADAVDHLREMTPVDAIFLDPSRRDAHGGKVVTLASCQPDVSALEGLLTQKASTVLVKLSPMLDLSSAFASLRSVVEAHVVAVRGECKELLLLLRPGTPIGADAVRVHCVNLGKTDISFAKEEKAACDDESLPYHYDPQNEHFSFTWGEERASDCKLADGVGAYLYEPNAALLKAGAFCLLTRAFPVEKLHVLSHLYTSPIPVDHFPGRCFRVEEVSNFGKRALRSFLQGIDCAHIAVRNFPLSAPELRQRLKLKEGGEVYLFATTLADGSKVLIKAVRHSYGSKT